jgi:hypothetical protein
MSFKDELREVIQRSKEENDRQYKEQMEFNDTWQTFRDTVLKVLKEAESVIKEAAIPAQVHPVNGGAILKVKWDEQAKNFQHYLKFSPQEETLEIICTSSTDEEEPFVMKELDQAKIQTKVKHFVGKVTREPLRKFKVYAKEP